MSLNLDFISSEFKLSVVNNSESKAYLFEGYRLDVQSRMLYRGRAEVALPPKAIETLIALIELRGEIVSKTDLMKIIWADTVVEESNLDHYLHVLRKALGQKGDGQPFIETLRRRGYRFTSDVQEIEPPNHNGTPVAPAGSSPAEFTDRKSEDRNGPVNFPAGSSPAKPVEIAKPSRFSPMFAGIAVLAGLFASVMIWYFQRPQSLNHQRPSPRGELSVTAVTNGIPLVDAAISPDGKYFVYNELSDTKYRLWLHQVGQASRMEITPPGEWSMGGKTFSPNGEFVYFVGRENGDDQDALYRIPTIGGPVTKIFTDIGSPISFSPDGNQIAFVRNNQRTKESQLMTAAVNDDAQRVLVRLTGSETLSLGTAWSPDGKFIAYEVLNSSSPSSEGNCSIKVIEVDTHAVKDLSPERWDTCYRMTWTSEGDGLIFIGTRMSESYTTRRDQVYYLSVADGVSRRISTDGSRYQSTSLGVTADNSLLVVPHKNLSQIWMLDANGDVRSAVQLTNGQLDGPAGIDTLPDGRIGYISRFGDDLTIWVMNADGSNQHQLGVQLPVIEQLRATADGRFFIFSARRNGFSHLYRVDTDGQNVKQLTDGESNEVSSTISPDGGWVYYVGGVRDRGQWKLHLQKTSIDGSQTVNLKELEADFVPNLSPDGKSIAAQIAGKLKVLSSADGTIVKSFDPVQLASWFSDARWTPGGESLTYVGYPENAMNIWVQPLSGSPPRPLTNFTKGYIYEYAFSRDGKKLYVARGYQVRDAVIIRNF